MTHPLKIAKLADADRVEFGPLAFYHPLVADGDTPVRTGIQTSAPGYVAPMHWHPYVELLFIIEGEAELWLHGGEAGHVGQADPRGQLEHGRQADQEADLSTPSVKQVAGSLLPHVAASAASVTTAPRSASSV